jgi:hypothetical protein
MRYVPYPSLTGTPNIVVDGKGQEATALTLSHWPHSGTPWTLKEDLSAQIVFHYLAQPFRSEGVEAVSNNHFDEDGLVSVYALVHPEEAERNRDRLIDIAAAGDFGTCRNRDGARLAFAIAACASPATSPLPASIFTGLHDETTAALYEEMLGRLPEMLAAPDRFRSLWQIEDEALDRGERAIAAGSVRIEEIAPLDLAVVTLPEGETCHPVALHNATGCFALLLLAGQTYELRYRYESWVQYVSRPPLPRVDLAPLAVALTTLDTGPWTFDGVDAITPSLRRHDRGPSALTPSLVRDRVAAFLGAAPPAWNPYDPRLEVTPAL